MKKSTRPGAKFSGINELSIGKIPIISIKNWHHNLKLNRPVTFQTFRPSLFESKVSKKSRVANVAFLHEMAEKQHKYWPRYLF